MSIKFITNEELYRQAIEPVARATSFVWIGTSDIKDLYVHQKGTVRSFLSVLDNLAKRKVVIQWSFKSHSGLLPGQIIYFTGVPV